MENNQNEKSLINKMIDFLLIRSENPIKQSSNRFFLKLSMYIGTAISAAQGMLTVSNHDILNIFSTSSNDNPLLMLAIPIISSIGVSIINTYVYSILTSYFDKKDANQEQMTKTLHESEADLSVLKKILTMSEKHIDLVKEQKLSTEENEILKKQFTQEVKTLVSEIQLIRNQNYVKNLVKHALKDFIDVDEIDRVEFKSKQTPKAKM